MEVVGGDGREGGGEGDDAVCANVGDAFVLLDCTVDLEERF